MIFLFGSQRPDFYLALLEPVPIFRDHTLQDQGSLFKFFEPQRQEDTKFHEVYFTTLNLMSRVLSDDVPTMIVKSPGSMIHFISLS